MIYNTMPESGLFLESEGGSVHINQYTPNFLSLNYDSGRKIRLRGAPLEKLRELAREYLTESGFPENIFFRVPKGKALVIVKEEEILPNIKDLERIVPQKVEAVPRRSDEIGIGRSELYLI